VPFEIAVGRNGKVWVNSQTVKTTLAIGKVIQDTDMKGLDVDEQKKLAKKLTREL
jgi:exosome complex component RRP40